MPFSSRRILFNILFWTFTFTLIFAIRYSAGNDFGFHELLRPIDPVRIYGNGLFMGISVGLSYTLMEAYVKNVGLYKHSLARIITNRTLLQFLITFIVLIVIAWFNFRMDRQLGFIKKTQVSFLDYLQTTTIYFLIIGAFMGNLSLSLISTLQMKIGEKEFFDLLTGKYLVAKEEDRAFLFIDLKSSTTIAERMGHEKYSGFIQECFRDLETALEYSEADVYQYVGDEVVLTWPTRRALKDNNCLKAFFVFEDQIKSRTEFYMDTYGTLPAFKGGLNIGRVMTAEVGVIKREIAFHSDVINTAARIMGMCNEKDAKLLVTEYVKKKFPISPHYTFIPLGSVILRGKSIEVPIYEVTPTARIDTNSA